MDRQKLILHNLAKHFGRNEAIFLQQLHYLLSRKKKTEADGRAWVYNTTEHWQADHFSFISQRTVERTIRNLETMGLVESKQWNAHTGDHTKHYRINYDQLAGYEQHSGRLLLADASTPFSSDLATQVGVNSAIFIYQLQHWLQIEESHMQKNTRSNIYDGRYWQFSTFERIREQMPWIKSTKTIQRLIANLQDAGLLDRVKVRKGYRYSLVYDGLPMLRELVAPTGVWQYTDFKDPDRDYELSHGDVHYFASLFQQILDFELDIYEDRSSLTPLRELVEGMGKAQVAELIREHGREISHVAEDLEDICGSLVAAADDDHYTGQLVVNDEDDPNEPFSRAWFDAMGWHGDQNRKVVDAELMAPV